MDALAKTKGKSSVPRPEPDLKILSLHAAPMPYRPQDGPFHFIATVQLPKEVDEQLMLEVSALVTSSASCRSGSRSMNMRRQPPAPLGTRHRNMCRWISCGTDWTTTSSKCRPGPMNMKCGSNY